MSLFGRLFGRLFCREPVNCPAPWAGILARLDKIDRRLETGGSRMDAIEGLLEGDMAHGRAMADALQVHMLREEGDIGLMLRRTGEALADMRRLIAIYERRAGDAG